MIINFEDFCVWTFVIVETTRISIKYGVVSVFNSV